MDQGEATLITGLATVGERCLDYYMQLSREQIYVMAVSYACGVSFIATSFRGSLVKEKVPKKAGSISIPLWIERLHCLCSAFLLLTSFMWWAFPINVIRVPLVIHSITAVACWPDSQCGVEVASWTNVSIMVITNLWELFLSLWQPWTVLDHYCIFMALSAFTSSHGWLLVLKLFGFERDSHKLATIMSGNTAAWCIFGFEGGIMALGALAALFWNINRAAGGYCASTNPAANRRKANGEIKKEKLGGACHAWNHTCKFADLDHGGRQT